MVMTDEDETLGLRLQDIEFCFSSYSIKLQHRYLQFGTH